jgi:hypothetical protein
MVSEAVPETVVILVNNFGVIGVTVPYIFFI